MPFQGDILIEPGSDGPMQFNQDRHKPFPLYLFFRVNSTELDGYPKSMAFFLINLSMAIIGRFFFIRLFWAMLRFFISLEIYKFIVSDF